MELAQIDVFNELWVLTKGGQPLVFAILLAGLYYVNRERIAVQKKYDDLFNRYIDLANNTQMALRDLRDLFAGFRRRSDDDPH
jgi:hypothetical protein